MSPTSLAERYKKFQEIITRQGNRKMYFMRLKHPSTLLFSIFPKMKYIYGKIQVTNGLNVPLLFPDNNVNHMMQ